MLKKQNIKSGGCSALRRENSKNMSGFFRSLEGKSREMAWA